MLERVRANVRYALGLRAFLRHPIGPDEARRLIAQRLKERDESFLSVAEAAIYGRSTSPYLKLLRYAGIELADLRRLVTDLGLEGALQQLYDAGVYVTIDEFKGRQPVRRKGLEFPVKQADFESPLLGTHFEHMTSGSRGGPARAQIDFDYLATGVAYFAFCLAARGRADWPIATWGTGGPMATLIFPKMGKRLEKSFTTIGFRRSGEGVRTALFNNFTRAAVRVLGASSPEPEFVPREDALKIAAWLAESKRLGTPATLHSKPSQAVRVCLAARQHGLDIAGSLFWVGGEPYTPAKAEIVESAGAEVNNLYAMVELGAIGYGCLAPAELDEVHLFTDKLAVIQREKEISGARVGGLFFTGTLPSFPRVMLNMESGDYGTLEQRDCGCPWAELGFSTHLSGIRSYEKLTSEGVTFVGGELYRLLEEVLPGRFGGHATDYQLVEEEEAGLSKVSIVVAPGVGPVDEGAVVETVLRTLKDYRTGGGEIMTAEWRQGQTLRVIRREPYATRTEKILPLHVLQATSAAPVSGQLAAKT